MHHALGLAGKNREARGEVEPVSTEKTERVEHVIRPMEDEIKAADS